MSVLRFYFTGDTVYSYLSNDDPRFLQFLCLIHEEIPNRTVLSTLSQLDIETVIL